MEFIRRLLPEKWMDRQTDKQTGGRTDKQTDGRTDAQTDRQTDKQTNRRTEEKCVSDFEILLACVRAYVDAEKEKKNVDRAKKKS